MNCRLTSLASYPRFLPIFCFRYLELGSLAYVRVSECSTCEHTEDSKFGIKVWPRAFGLNVLNSILDQRFKFKGFLSKGRQAVTSNFEIKIFLLNWILLGVGESFAMCHSDV